MSTTPPSPHPPLVDAHHHLWWNPTVDEYPWMTDELAAIRRTFGPDDLRPLLAACGVSYSVLVQTRSSLAETRHFLELAAGTDFIAGVVGWVDLPDPAVGETLDGLQAGAGGRLLKAIRHQVHDEPDPAWLLRDSVLAGLRAVQRAGLAYDLLIRPRELPAALQVARRLPELPLIVDHIAKPPIAAVTLDGWESGMKALSRCENVSCKLSGMVTEARWDRWTVEELRPYAERVLDWFGSERVIFGSDWPVCLLAASYGDVFGAARALLRGLSATEQARVLGGNAIAAYRLEVPGEEGREWTPE